MSRRRIRSVLGTRTALGVGFVAGVAAVVVLARAVDRSALAAVVREALDDPLGLGLAAGAFGAAFVLRAVAWRLVLPRLRFSHALGAIHLALGANHVLPMRLGEPLRVVSAVRRSGTSVDAAAASTLTLRAADVLAVVAIGTLVAPEVFAGLLGPIGWVVVAAVVIVAIAAWVWLMRVIAREPDVRAPGPGAIGLSAVAWFAEAVLVWQVARWAGIDLSWSHAVVVTTVAVAAQLAAVAPAGIGTYEAAAVAAYVALGYDAEAALVAAVAAHGLKTAYSLVAGGVAVFVPAPGVLGRLRLGRRLPDPPPGVSPDIAPVVLFMPAHDEEGSVGECVRRVPPTVCGRRVEVLVVDDGSTDATAEVARLAGAAVISLPRNTGLGAAVRVGLAEGVRRGAAAVVFCDADGEYPPEQLEDLVAPVVDGRADYVVGSRFLGDIEHMRPHRRLGNVVLTAVLSVVARRRITDGQSGYRAFSHAAARDAEIIHDFNYAQVLTLDLLAKGFRYHEVPIRYRFRTSGESFVRLGPYLRNVVPAVYRELNAA